MARELGLSGVIIQSDYLEMVLGDRSRSIPTTKLKVIIRDIKVMSSNFLRLILCSFIVLVMWLHTIWFIIPSRLGRCKMVGDFPFMRFARGHQRPM